MVFTIYGWEGVLIDCRLLILCQPLMTKSVFGDDPGYNFPGYLWSWPLREQPW